MRIVEVKWLDGVKHLHFRDVMEIPASLISEIVDIADEGDGKENA